MKRLSRGKKAAIILFAVALLLTAAFFIYVGDYYRADGTALEAMKGGNGVTVTDSGGFVLFDGPGTGSALIFYPGAKVEHTAYAPLMEELALSGVDCYLVRMPFNLAFFGMNSAAGIMAEGGYENWYLGGHSLGGAMAASFASKNPDGLAGLLLLAAYPTSELSEKLSVLSVYGSEDRVLTMEKVAAGRDYMPPRYRELQLPGGNHAWFGSYGEQSGDGAASITHEEQWRLTAEAVLELCDTAQS